MKAMNASGRSAPPRGSDAAAPPPSEVAGASGPESMMGAEVMCRVLEQLGVEVFFGHPGGAILPFYDAIHESPLLRHVLVRHEQWAAHAADGFARATGRVGVCLATSGPGATNLVTGLATALMDSVPVVAITGQVPQEVLGTEAFQETDIVGITMPVTKRSFMVRRAEDLPRILMEAFELARSGRPGPVLVDVPKDVQTARVPVWSPDPANESGLATSRSAPFPPASPAALDAVKQAARVLNAAKKPLIMAGRGVSVTGMEEALLALAEAGDFPVVTTLLAIDTFPRSHRLSLGWPGMHGTSRANRAIQEADVIVGLGLRFDDRVTGPSATFAPQARILHFDVDPAVVGRTVKVHLGVIGDLRATLPPFLERVEATASSEWWERLRGWSRIATSERGEGFPEPQAGPGGVLTGRAATRMLARHIGRTGAMVATDVGQHQMWMAQELGDLAPCTHLTSGGLGTMGFSLPAAIGAAMGRPDRPIWAVAGDGGFQMCLPELATVVQEGIPLKMVVVNNGHLGMVRQWQELFFQRRYSSSPISGPDLVKLGQAYGIPSRTVSRWDELEESIAWAEGQAGPTLLEFQVPHEENVYPMVPPGAALHQMVETAPSREG
ncbi:MAG: biosynthetic-type acetolactate synthase large subunit [Gemmatimonadota bacterium]